MCSYIYPDSTSPARFSLAQHSSLLTGALLQVVPSLPKTPNYLTITHVLLSKPYITLSKIDITTPDSAACKVPAGRGWLHNLPLLTGTPPSTPN